MKAIKKKIHQRQRRKRRVRGKVSGASDRPRLTVFRSHKNIYAQIIDDDRGVTLVSASTRDKDAEATTYGGNTAAAAQVGQALAAKAAGAGIKTIVFDRNGYRYHGRVKALAESAREGGLVF
ncbi:MAG: 50S ribosomal protein L18 [Planctomycetota bacterium]